MRKVIGIVDLHHDISLDFLTESRSIASTQFLGRYCFVDIPLSNFSNSGIKKVGILIKEKPRSLFRHLGIKTHGLLILKLVVLHYFIMKNMRMISSITLILIIF